MIRPTGVRWKKDGDRSWRWLNICVRNANKTLWPSLGIKMYCVYIAPNCSTVTARNTKAMRFRERKSPRLIQSIPKRMNRGTLTLPTV